MKISAEHVIDALSGPARPALTSAQILHRLTARTSRAGPRPLRSLLHQLVREGRLEKSGHRYRLPRTDGLVEGIFGERPGPRSGRGRKRPRARTKARAPEREPMRVRDDAGGVWKVTDAAGARPGDRVLLLPTGRPGERRGEILQVISGDRDTWLGIFHQRRGLARVTPYRDDARWTLRVASGDCKEARDGDVVIAVPARKKRGERADEDAWVRVTEVLGRPGEATADFRAVVWHRRLPLEFPAQVVAEAERLPAELDPEEVARRVDLRDRPFATIDPASARDHDDAVYCEPLGGGAGRLWVAIADVSELVESGSALDREALRRGNSVYFPDRVLPMLPERISGDLCSLVAGEDRLVLVVEMDVDAGGRVARRSVYPAVIRSRAKLSYAEAAAAMEAGDPGPVEAPLAASLRALERLTARLARRRRAQGSLDLDLPAHELRLDARGQPVSVVETLRTRAHHAIEESMLAANRCVAALLLESDAPAIYRVHEPPDPDALAELGRALAVLDVVPRAGRALTAAGLGALLEGVAGCPEEPAVGGMVLRALRRARYDARCLGHFALAFDAYLHFTSPIRRYADLVVHRALRAVLSGRRVGRSRVEGRTRQLQEVASRISWRERLAESAERERLSLLECRFMRDRIGEEHAGVIRAVLAQGLYVALDDLHIEGLVPSASLPARLSLDPAAPGLRGRVGGTSYRVGESVRIRVDAVDQVRARINFVLVGGPRTATSGRGRRGGKAGETRQARRASRTSSSSFRRSHSR